MLMGSSELRHAPFALLVMTYPLGPVLHSAVLMGVA